MPMWPWFRRSVLKRCTIAKFVFSAALVLVLYNEYLCFTLSSLTWASIPVKRDNADQMKILIVADPQIVGLQDEHWLFGIVTRWDCDKYLRSGFQRALNFVQPAVVVFLGDLIDEGSKASEDEYQSYVKRFHDIFTIPPNVQTVFVPGDNDVGGEWTDLKETWKVNRFYKHLRKASNTNNTIVRVDPVDFIPISFDMGEDASSSSALYAQLSEMIKSSVSEYRVVCNHMSVINRPMKDYKQILQLLKPSLILTAHTHTGAIYKCTDCKPFLTTEETLSNAPTLLPGRPVNGGRWQPVLSRWSGDVIPVVNSVVHSMNLNDQSILYEVMVPTCSYRMGVPEMGFGSAVLDSKGVFSYTVLWLPSRYSQFIAYGVFVCIAAPLLLLTFLCRTVFTTTKRTPRSYTSS